MIRIFKLGTTDIPSVFGWRLRARDRRLTAKLGKAGAARNRDRRPGPAIPAQKAARPAQSPHPRPATINPPCLPGEFVIVRAIAPSQPAGIESPYEGPASRPVQLRPAEGRRALRGAALYAPPQRQDDHRQIWRAR